MFRLPCPGKPHTSSNDPPFKIGGFPANWVRYRVECGRGLRGGTINAEGHAAPRALSWPRVVRAHFALSDFCRVCQVRKTGPHTSDSAPL